MFARVSPAIVTAPGWTGTASDGPGRSDSGLAERWPGDGPVLNDCAELGARLVAP